MAGFDVGDNGDDAVGENGRETLVVEAGGGEKGSLGSPPSGLRVEPKDTGLYVFTLLPPGEDRKKKKNF